MNFYYDPILGLQYTLLTDFFTIDIDAIPKLDIEYWLKFIKETGVLPIDSTSSQYIEYNIKITDYKL